jgi:hypothetical protein
MQPNETTIDQRPESRQVKSLPADVANNLPKSHNSPCAKPDNLEELGGSFSVIGPILPRHFVINRSYSWEARYHGVTFSGLGRAKPNMQKAIGAWTSMWLCWKHTHSLKN